MIAKKHKKEIVFNGERTNMESKKGKYLKSYIESKNGGFRVEKAYAEGIGSGSLLYIGEARGNDKNEWEFIPYGNTERFIATDECVEKNLNKLYVSIITGRNAACKNNPYYITKEDIHKWTEGHVYNKM